MTGKELIELIEKNKMENCKVFVGCEGYTNIEEPEYGIRIIKLGKKSFLICDNCNYTE